MERADENTGEREAMAKEAVRVAVQFYTFAEFWRRARGRRARIALTITHSVAIVGRLARIKSRFAHCNLLVGDVIYEAGVVHGYSVENARFYPPRPDLVIDGEVPVITITPERWASTRFTIIRAILDWLGLPTFGRVHSCARDCSRALGLPEECKRPSDLLQALERRHGWTFRWRQ